VLKIAPGPWGDVLAVSSSKGLHCLELFDFGAGMSNIAGKNWYWPPRLCGFVDANLCGSVLK